MYALVWTARFSRAAGKFVKCHRASRQAFANVLRDLEREPFQPHLKYQHRAGKLKGVQAISITSSYRITLTVIIARKEVILLDVGSHDEVYR